MNWILGKAILNRILNETFFGKIQTLNWIRLGIGHHYSIPNWKTSIWSHLAINLAAAKVKAHSRSWLEGGEILATAGKGEERNWCFSENHWGGGGSRKSHLLSDELLSKFSSYSFIQICERLKSRKIEFSPLVRSTYLTL